jgi:hypothetical protein
MTRVRRVVRWVKAGSRFKGEVVGGDRCGGDETSSAGVVDEYWNRAASMRCLAGYRRLK